MDWMLEIEADWAMDEERAAPAAATEDVAALAVETAEGLAPERENSPE